MSKNAYVNGTIASCLLAASLLTGCVASSSDESDSPVAQAPEAVKAAPARVRKDVKDLSKEERKEYVKAVRKLKKVRSPYDPALSYYDQFVAWHVDLYRCIDDESMSMMMMGHGGPAFLPWHREFVLLFENALRQVGHKDITVPYWDWTDPVSTAAVFQDDFMGELEGSGEDYAVATGPFRQGEWVINVHPIGAVWEPSYTPYLTRHGGPALFDGVHFPTAREVSAALARPAYDVAPFNVLSDTDVSFRNFLEGFINLPAPGMMCGPDHVMAVTPGPDSRPILHNLVHRTVGGMLSAPGELPPRFGTMLLPSSPNDPVFFLHHSNIDRIWSEWQALHGVHSYEPVSGYPGNSAHDPMMPYEEIGLTVTPDAVADIQALGYRYE